MSNGDEVSIICGEVVSIVDCICGFFELFSILVFILVLMLCLIGFLLLVIDSFLMCLLLIEIMVGLLICSCDISLGDDLGINGQLWDVNCIDVIVQ